MAENGEVAVQSTQDNTSPASNNGNQDQEGAQQQRPGFFSIVKGLVIRMLIIYAISSFFSRRGKNATEESGSGKSTSYAYTTNLYEKGTYMDMYVYLSENEYYNTFDEDSLFWAKKGLVYGDWEAGPNGDGSFSQSSSFPASEKLMNNGSIYIHVYFVKEGNSPDPSVKGKYSKRTTVYKSMRLNKYKRRHYHKTVNLLTGETDAHPDLIKKENSSDYEVLSHWHSNLTINLMDDHTSWVKGHIPAPLDEFIEFVPGMNKYYPVLYFNNYWNLNSDYQPINETTKVLNLTLTYSPISLFRWQMYAAQSMRNKWSTMLGSDFGDDENDQDSLKTAFLETNPYLLGLTIVVSIVHSIFEFLAFKNDIQFWRSRKSLEGLSVRSVFFNVFQSLIVVLYVLDNETNTVVKISVFIGLLIEIWKIHKVVNIKVDRENLLFGLLPRVRLEDKSTYTESQTKKYDMLAFKYLSWLLFPLMIGYAVYSVVYVEQKGWYSWVLSVLYGFLLTFGFIMMTPQLFINYKLKSVAHLPWRMLTYKALNTFIDDIFAFVIKMPTLYRIGCLRDDVIFFIYLYQRYIYRVDPTRVNEFGVSQEMLEENGSAIKDKEDSPDSKEDSEEKSDQKKDAVVKKENTEGKIQNEKGDNEEVSDLKGDNRDRTQNKKGDTEDKKGDGDSADSQDENEEEEDKIVEEKLPDPKPIAEKKND